MKLFITLLAFGLFFIGIPLAIVEAQTAPAAPAAPTVAAPAQVLLCTDTNPWGWAAPTAATVALTGNATTPPACAALSSVPAASTWVWVSTDGGASLTPEFISSITVAK